jgi:DNA-binding MarR family transcriptional regulator
MAIDQPSGSNGGRTVILGKKDVLAARRLLHLLLGAGGEIPNEFEVQPSTERTTDVDRTVLVARARDQFQRRRRRGSFFFPSMFGEPAWDMLLALYIHDMSGRRQTIGSLLQFSGMSLSTAKRWLNVLAAHDLVRRDDHPTDLRTAYVSLTPQAREKLDLYFSETIVTHV